MDGKLSVTFSADSVEGLCDSMRAWLSSRTVKSSHPQWEALILDTAAVCFAERLSVPVAEFIAAARNNVLAPASPDRDTRTQSIHRAITSLSVKPDSGISLANGNVELY